MGVVKDCPALPSIQITALRTQSLADTLLGPQTHAAAGRALLPEGPPDGARSRTKSRVWAFQKGIQTALLGGGEAWRGGSWRRTGQHILLSTEPAIWPWGWALRQEGGGQPARVS